MLRALPFHTFGEAAALDLEAHVYCARCYAARRIDPTADHLRDRCFATTRFLCAQERAGGAPCNTLGLVQIRPVELLRVGGPVRLAFLWCKRCVPSWEINHIPIDQQPWSAANVDGGGHFRCPGCGGRVAWHIHGPTWRPTYNRHASRST